MAALYQSARGWALPADAAPRVVHTVAPESRPLWLAAGVAAALVLLIGTLGPGIMPVAAGAGQFPPGIALGPAGMFLPTAPTGSMALLLLACSASVLFVGCYAVLRIAVRLVGIDALGMAIGAVLLGVAYLAAGATFISGTATFGGAFTGNQAALAVVMLSVALMLDGSPGTAVALLGIAFAARPEVALWGLFGLAGASVVLMRQSTGLGRAWLMGGACALVLAAPTVLGWGAGLLHEQVASGTLTAMGLEPNQFVAATVPLAHWVPFCCTLVLGLAAFGALGPEARPALGAFLGLLVLFVLGCLLPLLQPPTWMLSLRPMAADTLLQLLAFAAASAVVLRDLRRGGGPLRMAASVAIAVCLLVHHALLPLATLAMLMRAAAAHGELLGIERRIRDLDRVMLCRVSVGVVLVAALAGAALRVALPL
jgi:hypothetical protein